MKKISALVSKIEELETELASEERNILKSANLELQSKLAGNDAETLALQKNIIDKQETDFQSLNLARRVSIKKLDTVLEKLIGRNFTISDSEHWLLFSSLSNSQTVPSKILEIGTFDGITAAILAYLFPHSEIVTIDLPHDNEKFRLSYNRASSFNQYVDKRNTLIDKFDNISFVAINSVNLINWPEKSFDLIWVDGAHGYPVLPLDLYNSCRLIKKNGLVVVDDVFTNLRKSDEMYRSTAAIQTFKLFKDIGIIRNYKLIRKRLALKYNFKDLNEKFLGVIKF